MNKFLPDFNFLFKPIQSCFNNINSLKATDEHLVFFFVNCAVLKYRYQADICLLIGNSQKFEITEIIRRLMSENKITIGIKIPLNKATSQSNGPIKISNYSYFPSDEVGLGYISHVYLGRNDHTGEIVAIKVMDFSKEDELGQQLIQQELNILQNIKAHQPRHLLLLYDHFKINKHLYIVTQYCEGKDIAKALRKKKVLSQSQAQSIMKQLIMAYKQLYDMKIVHRDLKLSNVLVQQGQLKLADFGFSTKIETLEHQKCDYNVGSPFYMPPETLKFNKYSFKSDIWALGVMAYEMVYGKLPWKEKVESMLYDKIIRTNLQELFDPNVVVSEHYKVFIRSCLQVQVERRATPQFIITYVWPLANDYVEGLSAEPNSRPMSMLQQLGPGSFTNRKIATHNFIQETSFRSNNNSFSKIQPLREKSPNFLNKANQQSRASIGIEGKHVQEKHTGLTKESLNLILKIIISKVNYCRFLQQINHLLTNSFSYISQFGNLKHYIHQCLQVKIKEFSKLLKGNKCIYSQLPGLEQFKLTQHWLKLKQVLSFLTEGNQNHNLQYSDSNPLSQEPLVKTIRELKIDLDRNFEIVQELVYLYQLRLLQNHQNLYSFANHSKIQLLVSRKKKGNQHSNKIDNYQRLRSKLAILDL